MTTALPLHAIEQIRPDIYRLVFDGRTQPMPYRAGQFLSLELPCGSLRSFSLAQPCDPDGRLELHVRLHPGGRMAQWLPALSKGDTVRLHGPFGDCVWRQEIDADHIVMLATGTGIAPLHALLQTMLAADHATPLTLYWGARTLDEIYMLDALQELARLSSRFVFIPVLSRPAPGWTGERGHVQDIAARRHPDLQCAQVYACGSGRMVDAARLQLGQHCGLAAERFFADAFEPAEIALDTHAPSIEVAATMLDGSRQQISVATGASLYRGLKAHKLIHGVCGGKLSCGTCRVVPDAAWAGRLPAISASEQRLLASLHDYLPGERLACQIPAGPELNGLALNIVTSLRKQQAVTQTEIEAVGSTYDPARMLVLRELTFDAIGAIAAQIRPGMLEADALELAKSALEQRGLLQGWHGVYVRFGRNTVKSWSEKSEPGIVLAQDDIYFIDIGPTWQGLEGDGAMTFLTGANAEMRRCKDDARHIFDEVRARWLSTGDSGQALYDFAQAATERRGWLLNLELSGHRLSDFPHAAHFDGTMAEVGFRPSEQLWVLEIHIRHPQLEYGAYFEDLLGEKLEIIWGEE